MTLIPQFLYLHILGLVAIFILAITSYKHTKTMLSKKVWLSLAALTLITLLFIRSISDQNPVTQPYNPLPAYMHKVDTTTQLQQVTNTTQSLSAETSDKWQTYINRQYNFKFDYPISGFAQARPDVHEDNSNGMFKVGYYYSSGSSCLIQFEVDISKTANLDKNVFGCDDGHHALKVLHNGKYYYYITYESILPLSAASLKSFKFLDSAKQEK